MDYTVEAHNTATNSDNKIHDDSVARHYGFRGGLVPGVDVWAYLAHAPAAAWGLAWLEQGAMSARFLQPVYDGEPTTVHASPGNPGEHLDLEVRNPSAQLCASGTADLRGPAAPDGEIPAAPLPQGRLPAASPTSLAVGSVLGSLEVGFHAARASAYLADIRETLPLFATDAVAHPGWLLRFANFVLGANVALGPWIHVGSDACHQRAVHDGQRVETRARVAAEYERKGHRFVELDVAILADGDPAMRVHHTAIYEPRRPDAPG